MLTTLSLKSRLIAASTAWIAFGMIASWIVLSSVFQRHVTKQFYDELYVHLDELQRLATIDDSSARLRQNLSDPRYDVALSGYYWEIQQGGQVLARSASMQAAPLKTPPDGRADVGVHTHTIPGPTGTLLVAERLDWKKPEAQPVQYIIGTDQRHLDAIFDSFNATLSWSLAGLGLSMVLAAGLLILYAMRPMQELRGALARVRSGNAKALTGAFPTEVQPVVDDLNGLLTSTAELIQRARTQAGNIAHGLKTPLAILTDEAYRIGDQGSPESSQIILEQCAKMQTQIEYQTTRARVVASRFAPGSSTSLAATAAGVVSALSRLYQDRGLSIANTIPSKIMVACDSQDLQEILANLLDNACKHAKSTVQIRATNGAHGRHAEFVIEDDGEGLPPEAYEVVFNIGERWDTQKSGSGLGLAIARDLVRLYDGDIRLSQSQLGGLSATVTLPYAAHTTA